MKKSILALVVTILVIAGIVGYVWVFRGLNTNVENTPRLEGCSGSGLALIKYNGSVVKVRYEMHPDFKWEHGEKRWYCLVQVYFLQPINGVGGFGVPKEEFESKYLVRYLSNTTNQATLLESLNGEWVSAGGEELTKWWNNLTEVKASQIQDYIDKLWDRMENSNKYYNYSFPSSQWEVPPKPLPNQTVKVYSIRLWFGARLDILAYQNPTDPTKIEIIEYGTIENWTEFTELVSKMIVFYRYPGTDNMNPLVATSYFDFIEYNQTYSIAWKIRLDEDYSWGELVANNSNLQPEVSIMLEEPMIGWMFPIEYAYWQVIGFPTFGLASNILLPQNSDIETEVEWAVKLTKDVVLTNVEHPGNIPPGGPAIVYPSLLRKMKWGVCFDQSLATSVFATLALGMYSDFMSVNTTSIFGADHAISFILVPSSISRNIRDGIPSLMDIDGDGINDTLVLIVDTAHLSPSEILKLRESEFINYPFSVSDVMMKGLVFNSTTKYYGDATGMLAYPSSLPKPFVPPWWEWVEKVYPRNNNYTIENDPWKWLTRELVDTLNLHFENGTVWHIPVNVTPCITPEQVYYDLLAPQAYFSLDWDSEEWAVHVPPSVIVKGYMLVFKRILPEPRDIALQPPITPVNIGNPPSLKQTVPELEQWVLAKVKIDYNGNIQILQKQIVNCNK